MLNAGRVKKPARYYAIPAGLYLPAKKEKPLRVLSELRKQGGNFHMYNSTKFYLILHNSSGFYI